MWPGTHNYSEVPWNFLIVFKAVGLGHFSAEHGLQVISPAVSWLSLPCQHGQCTADIIPPFLRALIPNTPGCDCSDRLDPEWHFAGLMGDKHHWSQNAGCTPLGTEALISIFFPSLPLLDDLWSGKVIHNPTPRLAELKELLELALYAPKQKCWLCLQASAIYKASFTVVNHSKK